ncbi:TRAP transporter small permease [Azospirillum sp.]|uniref:TRAP transporter small permease n=1 Tax=Azospirillum sp. TaxID=34012 RepID=UPI003D74A267
MDRPLDPHGDPHGAGASPFLNTRRWAPRKSAAERGAEWLCQAILIAMMVMIGAEVVARGVLNHSLEVTDELGGYLLVALTFLSFSVCQVDHAFHRVEFVQARLGERGRAWSELVFDTLSFGFALILLWQTGRLVLVAWQSGETAPTNLATPLWLPYLSMPIGCAVLGFTLLRTLVRDVQRLAVREPGGRHGA